MIVGLSSNMNKYLFNLDNDLNLQFYQLSAAQIRVKMLITPTHRFICSFMFPSFGDKILQINLVSIRCYSQKICKMKAGTGSLHPEVPLNLLKSKVTSATFEQRVQILRLNTLLLCERNVTLYCEFKPEWSQLQLDLFLIFIWTYLVICTVCSV